MAEMIIYVSGLHCHSCVTTVTEELLELNGVSSVSIKLVPKGISEITLKAGVPLSVEQLQTTLTASGDFQLVPS